MEFIVCMILASIFTGGRLGVDMFHAAKGTTPPHVEKARLKAEQQRERDAAKLARLKAKNQPRPADGKPGLKDVAAVYWGDAMADAIEAHNRRRDEKLRQRAENETAKAENRVPEQVRPTWKQRAARVADLVVNGPRPQPAAPAEPAPPATPASDGPRVACDVCGATITGETATHNRPDGRPCDRTWPASKPAPTPTPAVQPKGDGITGCPRCGGPVGETRDYGKYCPTCDRSGNDDKVTWITDCPRCNTERYRRPVRPRTDLNRHQRAVYIAVHYLNDSITCPTEEQIAAEEQSASAIKPDKQGVPMTSAPGQTAPTGEAANYETAIAELDKIEAAQQAHLDQAQAALAKIQEAKGAISEAQASYRPAAEAAGSVHEHLTALNLDQETVANTGTMADAMPPNAVDNMFTQLEQMEAAARQQVANAEVALAATAAAKATIIAKYGDAHATVQGELGGDATFLGDGGGARFTNPNGAAVTNSAAQ
jgi:hypothetical protein